MPAVPLRPCLRRRLMNEIATVPAQTLVEGQTCHGFRVQRVVSVPAVRTRLYVLEHEHSGARLAHLHSTDPEHLFAAVFRTPPPDDTGLPHILEHTVLCGSRRYPVKDPFVELLKCSLATFLNAFTGPDYTAYPCASMNVTDFANLVGVYCDAVFHPLLSEAHFKQEGHHLDFIETGNPATPLEIKGIVYNEMKGAFSSLDGVIFRELSRHLFPDNAYGRESGGDPLAIPDLTYAQFCAFHRTYYHPSNVRLVVFSGLPTSTCVGLLDHECLSEFERIDVDTHIAAQPAWAAARHATVPYPIGADEEAHGRTATTLAWKTPPSTDAVLDLAFHVLDSYLLDNAASPLRKALIDSGLGAALTPSGYVDAQRDTYFTVGLKGMPSGSSDQLCALVRDTLAQECAAGLDAGKLAAAFHQTEIAIREHVCSTPLHLVQLVMKGWHNDLPPEWHLDMGAHLDTLRRRLEADEGYFEALIQTHLLDNTHCSVLTFVPDPELLSRTAAETARGLAERKAAMSPGELDALAEESRGLAAMQSAPNTPEALATLPRLAIADVPPEPLELPTTRSRVNAATLLCTDVFANGINYIEAALDLTGLDPELVPYLPLYAEALQKMGVAGDDYVRTAEREAAISGGMTLRFAFGGRVDEPTRVQPAVVIGYNALDRNLDAVLNLLRDRVMACDLDDRDRLRDIISQRRTRLRSALISRSSTYARIFAGSHSSRNGVLRELVSGLHAVDRFEQWADGKGEELDELQARLARIRAWLQQRQGLTLSMVGAPPQAEHVAAWLREFTPATPTPNLPPAATPGHGVTEQRDAFVIPSAVASVAVDLSLPDVAAPDASVLFMLAANLSYGYLWDEVRVKGSAYGVAALYDMAGGALAFTSSQDPNVQETLAAFEGASTYIATQMDLSADAVEQALIGAFRKLDFPLRGAEACHIALTRHLSGLTPEYRRAFRAHLRGVSADDVRRVNDTVLAPALRAANVCVLANQEKLDAANTAMPAAPLAIRLVSDIDT
jgi:Zn-dependent M16 (insulinase) family peptidase